MSPLGIGLAAFFAAWFVLSVVVHLRDGIRAHLLRFEVWGVIPRWNFFAPRPGVHDVHLLFRDVDHDGEAGDLAYVPMIGPRRWYHVVWHPDKYRAKVVSDIAATLQEVSRHTHESDGDPRLLMFTQSYVLALHLTMQMPREPAARARQFVLARHRAFRGEAEHQVLFFSNFHPFEGPGGLLTA
jgi:hypothetical protein